MTSLSLKNKTSRYFGFFLMFLTFNYHKLNSFQEKKYKNMLKISIYLFWMNCDLMVNYMEIQDFVELPCISLLPYTWNDTENVLENCETILEKVLEKCLNFFSENLYSPWHMYRYLVYFFSNLLVLDNKVSTMAADALAPYITGTSAVMVLTMQNKWVLMTSMKDDCVYRYLCSSIV